MTKILNENHQLKKIESQHKKPSRHLISTKESCKLLKNKLQHLNSERENFYSKLNKKKKLMQKNKPKRKTHKIFINLEISTNLNISLPKQQKVSNLTLRSSQD